MQVKLSGIGSKHGRSEDPEEQLLKLQRLQQDASHSIGRMPSEAGQKKGEIPQQARWGEIRAPLGFRLP